MRSSRGGGRGPQLLRHAGKQCVHEPSRVFRGVLTRQLDSLIDDDGRGKLTLPAELVAPDPQQRSVDGRHPLERPPFGEAPQERVDLFAVLVDAAHQPFGVLVGRDWEFGEQRLGVQVAYLALVGEAERSLPRFPPSAHRHWSHARARYSPLRVSTLIFSPTSTNSGTWTTRPVSSVAALRAPDTRSPCTPGSVSVTWSSTAAGRSTPTTCPW